MPHRLLHPARAGETPLARGTAVPLAFGRRRRHQARPSADALGGLTQWLTGRYAGLFMDNAAFGSDWNAVRKGQLDLHSLA